MERKSSDYTKIRNKTRLSTLSISPQHSAWSSSNSDKTTLGDQGYLNWKGRSQIFVICRWFDSIHKWPQKLYQRTSIADKYLHWCGRIQDQLKKSVDLLYTKVKEAEREIRESSTFKIVTNIIKYLGITLTKEVKDLFDKTLSFWRKKLKRIPENGRISHALGLVGST